MKGVLAVFLGGGVGSVARYLISRWITGLPGQAGAQEQVFPWGTFVVNIIACLVMGLLFQRSQHLALILYIAGSVVLCIAATGAGVWLSTRLAQQ